MPAEWYYLDGFEKHGPYSGKELKQLAASGKILPSTGIQQVSDTGASPWTRAGAVQGMFAGDVRHLLGNPICDDCGQPLENGVCELCELGRKEASPPNVPPIVTDLPGGGNRRPGIYVEQRYPNLRGYVAGIRFWAKLVLFLGIGMGGLWIFASLIQVVDEANPFYIIAGLIMAAFSIIVAAVFYFLLMVTAEMFMVFVDTEENTRRTALMVDRD
jgi:hypothetical protein